MSIVSELIAKFSCVNCFSLQESYELLDDVNKESIRARIYENLGICFERVSRGTYHVIAFNVSDDCVVIAGDGRKLSFLEDNSIDCIITDHPWKDTISNLGGNKCFAKYDTFTYTQEDFYEKARVLKDGAFLIEFLPAENENNFDYLYQVKCMARNAGLFYYCLEPWQKGSIVSYTGRNAKNFEYFLAFTKGNARCLRPDVKRNKLNNSDEFKMSGASEMLPPYLNIEPPSMPIWCSEKPVKLIQRILDFFTLEGEIVLDQFAGSGVVGEACLSKSRRCILVEKSRKAVDKIVKRLATELYYDNKEYSAQ